MPGSKDNEEAFKPDPLDPKNTKESRAEAGLFAKQKVFLEENEPKFSFHLHRLFAWMQYQSG